MANKVGTDDVTVASGHRHATWKAQIASGSEAVTSPGTLVLGGTTAGNYTLIGAAFGEHHHGIVERPANNDSETYGRMDSGAGSTAFTTSLQNGETVGTTISASGSSRRSNAVGAAA